ncbi:MAG TPA: TerC family protein [Streptosporangiaceae bacterium]|jgi:tellurite resistance protein TerC
MNVHLWMWLLVLAGLAIVVVADLFIVDRGAPKAFSMRQAGFWVAFYVVLAVIFGGSMFFWAGPEYAGQFFGGYLTEYSLSVDNLFVFFLLLRSFRVARVHQHRVLLVGIMIALLLRGVFIAVGAVALARFEWLFFGFGAFLVYTAVKVAREGPPGADDDEDFKENVLLRWARRVLPTTPKYDGTRLMTKVDGRRRVTPMLIVMIAIGTTDLAFALDSIPAIFGLTQEAFIVFTANAFALMGLRQLYFLLGGLLERLVYIGYGLAAILAFIGVKLFLQALNGVGLRAMPEIPTWASLGFIVVAMSITVVASVLKTRRDNNRARVGRPADVPPSA